MKKQLAVLLCGAMLLSGCGTQNMPSDTTTEQTTTTAPETTTTTPETTPAQTTTTSDEITLENVLTYTYKLPEELVVTVDNRELYRVPARGGNVFEVVSDKSVKLLENGYYTPVRNSTTVMSSSAEELTEAIKGQKFTNPAYSSFKSAYMIEFSDPIVTFSKIETRNLEVGEVDMFYSINDSFSVNAFIRKSGQRYEVIIDPAYMYGIPLLTDNISVTEFDINGSKYYADTLSALCTAACDVKDVKENEYVYAAVTFSQFNCSFNTKNGYYNTADIEAVEFITDDINSALNDPLKMDGDPFADKDPEMTEVYNALIDNLDTILTDDTYGIELLDMDFDGKPEVLVSKIEQQYQSEVSYDTPVDVDIYRIENGGLKYIDTLYNSNTLVYQNGNVLGLKTLDDGTRCWFGVSRVNRDGKDTGDYDTDYLYTLNGDKLEYKEAFCAVVSSKTYREQFDDYDFEYDYYFMGEKIVPEVTYDYGPYYEPEYDYGDETIEPDWEYHSWNGINATFGMWELVGFIQEDFCRDIEYKYSLYSDWLTNGSVHGLERINVSERTVAYKLAYEVDSFYLGEYDSANQDYIFEFLGAYAKPVIYLYPEEETQVSVEVQFAEGGGFTCTYPEYGEGWSVTAMPDGTLYDKDGNEYYCLYWEGDGYADFDMSKGFCVKGGDTAEFLREKLLGIGLTAREVNEFIIYWLPIMEDNKYNVITFHIDDYTDSVPMTVTPAPDTAIRVFMTFAASEEYVEIQPQTLPSYERNGFTVVEWGGGECELIK